MAQGADIAIRIASTFTGKKAFEEADTATAKLNKNVKLLAKTLGLAFGGAALVRYSKDAVKAFAADEAAAIRLATAVDNLGLSFFKVDVEKFISETERSAGILDDELRPAMQALLNTTGSLTKSQKLLTDAIQISRGSGVDLATVAQDLANGYVGITKGLKKYNTGLTQTELKTKSFSDVLGILLTKSAGAADTYLESTSYKMDVLRVASANASETIGKGLVDAFAKLGGGSTAEDAAKTMDSIAKGISGITIAIGTVLGAFGKLYKAFDQISTLGGLLGAEGTLFSQFENRPSTNRSKSPAGTYLRNKQQIQAEAAAAKRAKELAALTKKQVAAQKALTAEQKRQNVLKKAGSIFDLDQIQIIAALKGKVSDEDRKRLELQLALETGNVEQAQKLTFELAMSQGLTKKLAESLASLPAAKNPFGGWLAYFDILEARAREVANMSLGGPQGAVATGGGMPSGPDLSGFSFAPEILAAIKAAPPIVNVTLDGQQLTSQITVNQQNNSLSGITPTEQRLFGSF